jgi:hypothetical protein
MPWAAAGLGRRVARVALVHPGQLHVLAGHRLHLVRQCRHLGTLVGVGGRDRQRQQSAQRIHGLMYLGALAPLVAVVASPCPTLGARLQHAAVEDRRRGLSRAPERQAQQQTQVMDQGLKAAGVHPAPRLLVDRGPGRKVGRQQPPGSARAHQPAQGIEDLAQRVAPLQRVFGQQQQVGGDQCLFVVADVGGIGVARRGIETHPSSYHPPRQVHNSL